MMKALFPVLILGLTLVGCDLSGYLKTEAKANSTETTSGNVYITRFYFTVATNPLLTTEVEGTIDNTNNTIAFTLPYKVTSTGTVLTPVIETSDGASMNISGAQNFANVITYQVTSADGSATRSYKTATSTDSASISYLSVDTPFYINSSGTAVAIDSYTFNTSTPNTIDLVIDPTLYTKIKSYKLGYKTTSFPANSVYDLQELLDLRSGQYPPYYVTVTSSDKTFTNKYTFSLSKKTSSDGSLVSLTAHALSQQYYHDTVSWDNSAALTAMKSMTLSTNYVSSTQGSVSWSYYGQTGQSTYGTTYGSASGAVAPTIVPSSTLWNVYQGITTGWSASGSTVSGTSGSVSYSQTGTTYANVTSASLANSSAALYLATNGYTDSLGYVAGLKDYGDIDITSSYTNSQSFTPTATETITSGFSSPLVISDTFKVNVNTGAYFDGSANYVGSRPNQFGSWTSSNNGGWSNSAVFTAYPTLNFIGTGKRTYYEPTSYYLIYSITATKPTYAKWDTDNLSISSTYVTGYTINGDTLTFTLKDPGTPTVDSAGNFTPVAKQTGLLAVFGIISETGTEKFYSLNLK